MTTETETRSLRTEVVRGPNDNGTWIARIHQPDGKTSVVVVHSISALLGNQRPPD